MSHVAQLWGTPDVSQSIPANVETQIEWCCEEITSAGLSVATGVNAGGIIASAGTYLARATLNVAGSSDRVEPTIQLATDDDTTDFNVVYPGVQVEWSSAPMDGVDGWEWVVSAPTRIVATFTGEARFTLAVQGDNGLSAPSADVVAFAITKNAPAMPAASDYLNGGVLDLRFDFAEGQPHGHAVTFDDDVAVGDFYEVWGIALVAPVNPVTFTTGSPFSRNVTFVAERTSAPTITASLDLYDPTDTFVATIDTQTVRGFHATFSLGGVFTAQSGFKVACSVSHTDDASPKTIADESHLDIIKVGGYLAWESC